MNYDDMVDRIIVSYDFHSKKEYDEYMDEHPKADKSNHKVLDQTPAKDKKNNKKFEKIRKKVEQHTTKDGEGDLDIKISGSCDMVKNLVSAIGGKTRFEEGENGRCTGHMSLNDKNAEKLLASVRGK